VLTCAKIKSLGAVVLGKTGVSSATGVMIKAVKC